jgi:hypothetical protein
MSDTQATLVAHVDTNLVTRAQLADLPPVQGTDTFKPVPHIELIESLEAALRNRNIRILREQFSINGSGNKLFGTLDVNIKGIAGSCASIGLRTANDKSMSIQMIAGMRIFVCDNMAFTGDLVCVKRRHTAHLNLFEELELAVTKYERHYRALKAEVNNLKDHELTDVEAKVIIYNVFAKEAMPVRLFPTVAHEYFEPRHAEFAPRNAWSLLNAFTEAAKLMPLTTRIDATQEVGRYFGLMGA